MTDEALILLSASGILGLLNPRLGFLFLALASMGKFFGR